MTDFSLNKHPSFSPTKGPVIICVMDGVGIGPDSDGNAVRLAHTPNLDKLSEVALCSSLKAHGVAVGLPSDADMGNSEVGHNAIGAGRVFDQGSKLVGRAISSGALFEGKTWRNIVAQTKDKDGALHLIGLVSDGNVHSHIDQLFALIRRADEEGITKLFVHALLDGRDVPETSAMTYIEPLEELLAGICAKPNRRYAIASGGGRMVVTMDRYNANWSVVERGWNAHVHGQGRHFSSAQQAIETYRKETPGLIDQYMPEFVIDSDGSPVGTIQDGDAVVFFNFRGDRAIEISRAFEDGDEFDEFDRGRVPQVLFAGMMQYDGDLLIPKQFLVEPPSITRTVGEYLARNSVRQLAIAETQKFGHVTYFWNGNRSGKFDEEQETYICIDSDLRPFAERPWMKSAEVADALIDEVNQGNYRHIRVNFANGDMVGHTGKLQSAIQAVEAVDLAVGRLMTLTTKLGGVLVVIADHGNADEMFELDKKTGDIKRKEDGTPKPKTSHTLNPVPMYLYAPGNQDAYRLAPIKSRGLSNIASTLLNLLGYEAPNDYDPSLIEPA